MIEEEDKSDMDIEEEDIAKLLEDDEEEMEWRLSLSIKL